MAGRVGEICPFCGSTHAPQLSVRDEIPSRPHVVICRNCGARGPAKELPEHAIAAWNRRAQPVAPTPFKAIEIAIRAQLAEMETEVKNANR